MTEKKNNNPFSFLGEDNPQEGDRVNDRIQSELEPLLKQLGLNLEGNKLTIREQKNGEKDGNAQRNHRH